MRISIPDNPQVELLGHDRARLLRPFTIYFTDPAHEVKVPAGFETDFVSVLRLPLLYLVAGNTAHRAAIVHDYLYSQRANRTYADRVFLAVMEAEGVRAWRRWPMYLAVRLLGRFFYGRGA